MEAGTRRGDLRVGVKLLNYVLCPRFDLASLGVAATVQVHAAKWVVPGENEPYAVVTVFPVGCHSLGVIGPASRIRAAGSLPRERGVRYLGHLAVAFLVAPANILPQASHVLSVCYL